MASAFSNGIEFLATLGIYDVVLPFILTFVIMYAILDKTKVLGTENDKDKTPRKNLNSLTAFCIAFFVIASSQLVAIINTALAQIVILLFISVFYLVLIGSFSKNGEDVFLQGGWKTGFMVAMLVGIILIFSNTIKPFGTDQSVLEWIYFQLTQNFNSNAVSSIVLIAIVIGIMYYVTKGESKPAEKKKEEKSHG